MDNEILKYRQRLKERAAQKPIWEKACLTIEEAAEYTGIGRTKLRALVRQKNARFQCRLAIRYLLFERSLMII